MKYISHRCEVHKVVSDQKELRTEYYTPHTEVKELRGKTFCNPRNEVVEKTNVDFKGSR